MRLRVALTPSVELGQREVPRKLVLGVPKEVLSVAELAKFLRKRTAVATPEGELVLSIGGFVLRPSDWLQDLVRDGDAVSLHLAGNGDLPARAWVGQPDEATSPPARKRPRRSAAEQVSPATLGWVEALAAKMDAQAAAAADEQPSAAETPAAADERPSAARTSKGGGGVGGGGGRTRAASSNGAAAAAASSKEALKAAKLAAQQALQGASAGGLAAAAAAVAASTVPAVAGASAAPQQKPFVATPARYEKKAMPDGGTSLKHPLLGELEVPAGKDPDAFVTTKLKQLRKAIKRQLEWYFGDVNWSRDAHIRMLADDEGFVQVSSIADFERLKALATDQDFICQSAADSEVVEVSPCGKSLRRRSRG